MKKYEMRGTVLYNTHNRRVAMAGGESIYDASDRRVGRVHGDDLLDSDGRIMMTVRDHNIYDSDNTIVAALSEAQGSISGAVHENLVAALWYCFIR